LSIKYCHFLDHVSKNPGFDAAVSASILMWEFKIHWRPKFRSDWRLWAVRWDQINCVTLLVRIQKFKTEHRSFWTNGGKAQKKVFSIRTSGRTHNRLRYHLFVYYWNKNSMIFITNASYHINIHPINIMYTVNHSNIFFLS
jgi:hypothetical protein